jgi:regulator of sigma E protease
VDEFSFGFQPKLFGKKIGETQYNFNALPLGGYVKIYGENMEEADFLEVGFMDKDDPKKAEETKRSMAHKPRYIQALVLIAGVVMNFLVAWILLSVGFMSGLPTSIGSAPAGYELQDQALTVTSVLVNSPAEIGGLKTGDKIISLDTAKDSTKLLSSNFSAESVQDFVKKHDGDRVNVSIIRGKEPMQVSVVPKKSESGSAMIGISMDMIGTLRLPVHKAVWEGLKLSGEVFVGTVVGFYNLIHGALIGQGSMSALTGPVGIVGVVGDAAKFGFIYLLSFTALISINLAVINLIPFPALDGGRLLFLLIEKIKGSRINSNVANVVNTIGFGLLMLLMAVITYHDIAKLL